MVNTTVPKCFSMMNIELNVKLSSEESSGTLSAIEQRVEPGAGSPPHILSDADKMIYIIEGKFLILKGEENIEAGPGDLAFLPKGVVHNFKNIGKNSGKILVTLTPGGHEEFLYDLSLNSKGKKPSREEMIEIGKKHSVEII